METIIAGSVASPIWLTPWNDLALTASGAPTAANAREGKKGLEWARACRDADTRHGTHSGDATMDAGWGCPNRPHKTRAALYSLACGRVRLILAA